MFSEAEGNRNLFRETTGLGKAKNTVSAFFAFLFLFSWQSAFITGGSKKQKSKTYIKIVE